MFDQQPVVSFAPETIAPHKYENEATLETLAIKLELQVALFELLLYRAFAFGLPIAAVPEHDRAATILALGDRSFEIPIVQWMVFNLNRKPLVVWGRATGLS